jgi:hypothetical protein
MIKTAQDVKIQKEELLKRKPALEHVEIKPLSNVFGKEKQKELADFIHHCWADTYGPKQDMFDYDYKYLDCVFGDGGLDSNQSLVATQDRKVLGVSLATPRTFIYKGKEMKTYINAALSINPDIKSNGLGRYIFLMIQENIIQNHLGGAFFWYHSSIHNKFSSHKVHTQQENDFFDLWGHYSLNSRVFDIDRAINNAHLKSYEALGLRLFAGRNKGSDSERLEEIREQNVEEICNCLNSYAKNGGEGRIFSAEELKRETTCIGGEVGSNSYGLFQRNSTGNVIGIAVGYNITIIGKNKDNVFFLDNLYLGEGINKQRFINNIENHVSDRFGVFGIVTLDQRLGIMNKYLPSGTVLSCYSIPFHENFLKTDYYKRKTPILDHK